MSRSGVQSVWALQAGTSSRKLVLLALADGANDDGLVSISIATLAKRTELSLSTIRRTLSALRAARLIETAKPPSRTANGTWETTTYRLPLELSQHAPTDDPPADRQWSGSSLPKNREALTERHADSHEPSRRGPGRETSITTTTTTTTPTARRAGLSPPYAASAKPESHLHSLTSEELAHESCDRAYVERLRRGENCDSSAYRAIAAVAAMLMSSEAQAPRPLPSEATIRHWLTTYGFDSVVEWTWELTSRPGGLSDVRGRTDRYLEGAFRRMRNRGVGPNSQPDFARESDAYERQRLRMESDEEARIEHEGKELDTAMQAGTLELSFPEPWSH